MLSPTPGSIHVMTALTAGWYATRLSRQNKLLDDAQLAAVRSSIWWAECFMRWALISGIAFFLLMVPMFFLAAFIWVWPIALCLWFLVSQTVYVGCAFGAAERSAKGESPYPPVPDWISTTDCPT